MKLIKYKEAPSGLCLTDCPFKKAAAVSSITCTECISYICEIPLIKVVVCKQDDNWEAV